MRALILCLVTTMLVPMTGDAQTMRREPIGGSSAQPGAQSIHAASGPTIEAAALGIRLAPSSVAAVSTESRVRRRSDSHDVALIVVGVGAMVAGGVIGGTAGTIFLVGGAVIGLYGLFNLLQ
jgi:hypothetical protein